MVVVAEAPHDDGAGSPLVSVVAEALPVSVSVVVAEVPSFLVSEVLPVSEQLHP